MAFIRAQGVYAKAKAEEEKAYATAQECFLLYGQHNTARKTDAIISSNDGDLEIELHHRYNQAQADYREKQAACQQALNPYHQARATYEQVLGAARVQREAQMRGMPRMQAPRRRALGRVG